LELPDEPELAAWVQLGRRFIQNVYRVMPVQQTDEDAKAR